MHQRLCSRQEPPLGQRAVAEGRPGRVEGCQVARRFLRNRVRAVHPMLHTWWADYTLKPTRVADNLFLLSGTSH